MINDKELIYPRAYTRQEGGTFLPWNGKPVTRKQLEHIKNNKSIKSRVQLSGCPVHSLIFATAMTSHGNCARWDVINGWTNTIEEAENGQGA